MIRAQWLVATTALALLMTGCSGNDSETMSEASLVTSGVTVPLPGSVVEIIEAGETPHEVLTFHPGTDSTQQATLRTQFDIKQVLNAQAAQDFSNPMMTIPVTATASDHDIELTLGRATCSEESLNSALESAAGGRAGWRFGSNGTLTSLWLRPVDAANDNARAAIEQSLFLAVQHSVSLPGEPIGIGAKWRVRQDVPGTMPLQQITEFTLVERDGDVLTIDVHVVQEPRSNVWNLPDGAGTLNIEKFTMTGGGRVVLDLSQPVPREAIITLTGEQSYVDPKATTSLRQTSSSRVEWASR